MNHPIELLGFYSRLRSLFATFGFLDEYNEDLPGILQTLSPDFAAHFSQEHGYHDWELMNLQHDTQHNTLEMQLCMAVYADGMKRPKSGIVTLSFNDVEEYRTANLLKLFGFDDDDEELLDIDIAGMYFTETGDDEKANGYRCCVTLVSDRQISFRFQSLSFRYTLPSSIIAAHGMN